MTEGPTSPSGAERRQHPRESVHLAARLVLGPRRVLNVMIIDRSIKGMRIRLPADAALPQSVTVLELQAAMAHQADVVWARSGEAGLSLRSSSNVRTASGPAGEALRQLWRDVALW